VRRPIGRTIHCSTALPTVKANVTGWFAYIMFQILNFVISCAYFVAGTYICFYAKERRFDCSVVNRCFECEGEY